VTRHVPSGPGELDDASNGDALGDDAPDDDALDAEPLDEAEAASGASIAGEGTGESLEDRVRAVIAGLGGVAVDADPAGERLSVAGRVFAVVSPGLLEVALDQRVARAALATPDTQPSARGAGWLAFSPAATDRFVLDRAEAWIRLAHRRATVG
jgi:hypothetical protein